MAEITDPSVLSQLNTSSGTQASGEVTDPNILAQLNGTSYPTHQVGNSVQGNAASGYVADTPKPIVGQTKMPDGSTYTGQPWQDAIFSGQTHGLHGQEGENALAEMGRKTVELGRGAKQFSLVNKKWTSMGGLAEALNSPNPELDAYNQQLQEQHQQDAPLANSPGGQIGGTMFDLAEGAMLPGGIVKQAATQAGLGMLNPVDVKPGESYLGAKAMQGLKTGVGSLAGGAAPAIAGKIAQPFVSNLSAQGTKDLGTLAKNGINTLDAAQLTGNESANVWKRFVPNAKFQGQQNTEVTNALLTKYAGLNEPETQAALQQRQFWAQKSGGDADTIGASPDVMGAIRDGATNARNDIFNRNPSYLTAPFNDELNRIRTIALRQASGPHDADAITGIINALQGSAKRNSPAALRGTGIPGKIDTDTFQAQYDQVSSLYNTKWAGLGGQLKDAMNSAFTASAQNPQDALKLWQINQRLANLHKLGDAVDDSNNITLPNLKKAMDKKNAQSLTTFGSQTQPESRDLWNLADAGNRVFTPPKVNNASVGARLVGAGLTGVGIGAGEGLETGDWTRAAITGVGGMLGGWTGNKLIYSKLGRGWANAAKSPLLGNSINAATRVGTAVGANQTQIPTMLNTEPQEQ